MDLDSLRCFLAVADTLQFRVAAERLALSPAALSDRIRRLEEELGVDLFTRTTRRVQLTDGGRRLVPHAHQLLDAAARTASIVREDRLPQFALTIGTRYELGLSWLCPALLPLAAQRPERTLHLYMGDSGVLLDRLERGSIDACVLSARLTRPHIRYALLHEETYVFVSAGDGPTTAEDAGRFTLVDATPDLPLFRYLLDALPDGVPWRFAHNLYVGGIGAIRHMVLAGAGVAVLPRYFVGEDLAMGRLREVLPEPKPGSDWFRLLWRVDHPREEEMLRLAEALRAIPLR